MARPDNSLRNIFIVFYVPVIITVITAITTNNVLLSAGLLVGLVILGSLIVKRLG